MESGRRFLSPVSPNFKMLVDILFEGLCAWRIVPVVLNQVFKVIVSVDGCTHILIVVLKFTESNLASCFEFVKLSSEFLKDFCAVHLASHKLRMSFDVIVVFKIFERDWLFSFRDCFESKSYLCLPVVIEIASKSMQEFLMINFASIVSIKILV